MLILTLAHAQTTKDYSLISNFVRSRTCLHIRSTQLKSCVQYNLLDGWAQYLVANALAPNAQ